MPAQAEPLGASFPTASEQQWRSLVSAVLRKSGLPEDADPIAALSSHTYDGIDLHPLYTAADAPDVPAGRPGRAPFVRGSSADGATVTGWDVRQRHADPDPKHTRDALLADLESGATSVWLVLGDGGLAIEDLPTALDGVYLDLAPIAVQAGTATLDAALALLTLGEQRGVDRGELRGTFGADPIGTRARTGAAADLGMLPTLAEQSRGTQLRIATADGTAYHDAGGSDADELGIATSVGVAYLRALTDGGLSIEAALAAIEFRFAVTADQFASIAKLRAARRVWARVAQLCGASGEQHGQLQHAVTSSAMLTRRDPWVNMLRTAIGCFGAALGGADAITVAPFDAAIGLPDAFARRIARNTHAILHDESSLGRVIDAGGGSWYVESFTDSLAEQAWARFTALERAGGALAALDDGTIESMIAAARDERASDIAHRRAPITGVSEYAFPAEQPVEREPAQAAGGGVLPLRRWAEPFESLRDRADAADTRPTIFLAALGSASASSARVGFATNLFQAGGIEVVVGRGEPDEIVAAFLDSGTPVACLCSSDKVYAEVAASESAALKAAGARWLWLAGTPGEDEGSDRSAGIDGYVHTGCDALDVLTRTLDVLEVP